MKYTLFLLLSFTTLSQIQAQDAQLIGLELAKSPATFEDAQPYNFGTKLNFFVSDTATVTGLTTSYSITRWVTNTAKDLKQEHQLLTRTAVSKDYRIARDTTFLAQRDFWYENGKGFTFKLHSWAIPDSITTSIIIKGEIEYTVLESGETLVENITHLAGNIDGLNSLDFMGNTIDLKQKTYGKGEDAYMTFSGTVTNKAYRTAIQNMQFLDQEGKVLDELYFGLNNQYNTSTRNRIDLKRTRIIRMYYSKILIKKVVIDETFGIGL